MCLRTELGLLASAVRYRLRESSALDSANGDKGRAAGDGAYGEHFGDGGGVSTRTEEQAELAGISIGNADEIEGEFGDWLGRYGENCGGKDSSSSPSWRNPSSAAS